MGNGRVVSVLNIHWGFSLGGISQYAAVMEGVGKHAPVEMSTVCILNRKRLVDAQTLGMLDNLTLIERNGPLDFRWVRQLIKIIRERVPDLVFTHAFNGHFAAFALKMAGVRRTGFVASYHGSYHPPTRLKGLLARFYEWFTEWYLRQHAQAVVTVAEYCKDHLITRGVAAGKITVIHNGIPDISQETGMTELRRELSLPPDGIAIGAMSRLDPVKGISYLLRAFQKVVAEFPDTFLVIIGTGTQEDQLRQLATELGIQEHVHFAGFCSNAARLLGAFDIFALPSLAEYHSIGLLEAMRAGRAIVTTDVGGNTESVTNDSEGLVVRAADVDGLAQALRLLVANPGLRQRLGVAARERFVREFVVDNMARDSANWLVCAAD